MKKFPIYDVVFIAAALLAFVFFRWVQWIEDITRYPLVLAIVAYYVGKAFRTLEIRGK